jgi:hypothetical protein
MQLTLLKSFEQSLCQGPYSHFCLKIRVLGKSGRTHADQTLDTVRNIGSI